MIRCGDGADGGSVKFQAELRDRGASAAYQHRRHREVKAFFSWCRRMGLVEENVFARVPLVRLEQKIIEPFSQAEVACRSSVPGTVACGSTRVREAIESGRAESRDETRPVDLHGATK